MFEVLKPGLQTCIQDYPGRIGYWNLGFPPSGPMDSWSFRLANLLVGNEPGAAGLEIQLMGPTLRFAADAVVAVSGAVIPAKLDDAPFPLWESVAVRAGQTLALGVASRGARAYFAIAGALDTPELLGSRSTFAGAGVGGIDGGGIKKGQQIAVGAAVGTPGKRVGAAARPPLPSDKRWAIDVVRGPNDDWVDEAGHERFLSTDWRLSPQSARTGYRLEGPDWTFTEKATNKGPEHGAEPSNILDQGYPLGGINLGGQTPIILVHDAPSMGGFICPYTVPTSEFWKLGQSKPGDLYHFRAVSVEAAQIARRALDSRCSLESLE
jgi:urea carboxylase